MTSGLPAKIKLRPKQELFCQEFVKDHNATRAYIAAGYAPKKASENACALRGRQEVQERIAQLERANFEQHRLEQHHILGELAKMASANMLDYIRVNADGDPVVDLSKLTREQAAAIQEVTVDTFVELTADGERQVVKRVKFKLADKYRGLELLGKHMKMFTDRLEIPGLGELADLIALARQRAASRGVTLETGPKELEATRAS